MPDQAESHIMLDLETWGTGARAVIVEIGAVVFEPLSELLPDEPNPVSCFYSLVSPQSGLHLGMEVDADTILWWLNQDEETRKRLTRAQELDSWKAVHTVLDNFNVWLQAKSAKYIWAHGATFDPVVLTEYYRRLRKEPPFNFRNVRDTRTLFSIASFNQAEWDSVMKRTKKHHPVYDAWAQARAVQYCLQKEEHESSEESAAPDHAGAGTVEQ